MVLEGKLIKPQGTLFIMEDYLIHLQSQKLSERTIKEYCYYYRKVALEMQDAGIKLKDFTNEIVEYFVSKYNNGVFRAFLKDIFDWKNVNIKIPKIKGSQKRKKKLHIKPYEVLQIKNFLTSKYGYKFGLMLDLTYFCALRRSETIGIRSTDFNWEEWLSGENDLIINLSADYTKRKKDREIIVPKELAERLLNWVQKYHQEIDNQETLFGVGETKWRKAFRDAILSTDHDGFTLHGLRRSRATYWEKHGLDIRDIQTLLGHADISTTQLYLSDNTEKALSNLKKIQ